MASQIKTNHALMPLEKKTKFTFSRSKFMHSRIVVENGLMGRLREYSLVPEDSFDSKHYLITDNKVDGLYGDRVLSELRESGLKVNKFVMKAGENSKSLSTFAYLTDKILKKGIDKKSYIISLGGGVVNNMCGMIAATLYRGIGLIHITTSSMGQVDAAIDFKQAVNSTYGKNLIGAYHPASLIIVDPISLCSLSNRHLRNGISEAIKHALCQSQSLFDYFIENAPRFRKPDFLEHVVQETLDLKVVTLNGDQKNDFNEMVPQYGHCVGHAIEHLSKYDLLHGEAIAIGMCVCAEISVLMGVADEELVEQHWKIFEAYNLPTVIPNYMSPKDIVEKIRYDKHYVHKEPTIGILTEIGTMYHESGVHGLKISQDLLLEALVKNTTRQSVDDERAETFSSQGKDDSLEHQMDHLEVDNSPDSDLTSSA